MKRTRVLSISLGLLVPACGADIGVATGGGGDGGSGTSSSDATTTASSLSTTTVSVGTGGGGGGSASVPVIPVDQVIEGNTYAEWSAVWFQWITAIPAAQNPWLDDTGANCAVAQSGPVFFLSNSIGIDSVSVTRACTIPTGSYLFFPLLNYINDYPCPDPNFQPGSGQTLEEFLAEGAVAALGNPSALSLELDGVSFSGAFDHRVTSAIFDFTADASLNNLDPCFTNTVQQGVSDGFWIMLPPLAPGAHTLHFSGTNTAGGPPFTIDTTYNLTVQ